MSDTNKSLSDGAAALAEGAVAARHWVARVARTADSVASEERSLLVEARRAENFARKLAESAPRRNSVGVFGPSQAGKSYLVSVLGRNEGNPLLADFAGTLKNFIQEINPGGGKESTGLVTRFTIVEGSRDAAFPVELRLLTETDLVKILGNSFLSDFSQHARKVNLKSEADIRADIARLEAQAARSDAEHLDEIAMFDIGEYFQSQFESTTRPLTNAGYWDALTRFGARLARGPRIEMYSQLWGGVKEVTAIFGLMQAALDKLGHATQARTTLEGLEPRQRSLINVDLVQHDLGTPADQKDLLDVVAERADGSDAAPVQIARSTLCALTAELKIVMSASSWPFFQHTDLLDFPGARSREQLEDLDADTEKRVAQVRNMVRRGKISYLFQRYTEQRELSTMLLCMPPKPAEVKDLSGLVREWVKQTHGDTPEQRAGLSCALFFVLTFFDQEIVSKTGDTPDELRQRIDTRMESSMFGLYKHEGWFQNWAHGKPFANTYFMRNPEWPMPGVMKYVERDGKKLEAGFDPDAKLIVDQVQAGMLDSENAKRHFDDPAQAWEAAVAVNDGGVSYLVGRLDQVLSPELKTRQLSGRLRRQVQTLDARLRRFYQADDEHSRKKKDDALVQLRRDLHRASVGAEFRNFFQLLACMKLDEPEVRAVFLNVGLMRIDPVAAAESAVAPEPSIWDDDPWAEKPPSAPAGKPKPAGPQDRFDLFASQVVNVWTERLRTLSSNERLVTALRIDGAIISEIANEVVIAANREKLIVRIADRTRAQVAVANLRPEDAADRSAGIATMIVNDFVGYLGFVDVAPEERPVFPEGASRPPAVAVFERPSRPEPKEMPGLGERRRPLEREYFRDWGVALRKLGLDNLSHVGGREIGEEDNRLLGQALRRLAQALPPGEG